MALLASFIFPAVAVAQQKTPPKKRPPAGTVPLQGPRKDGREQARKLADQLKLLSRFLYVYGKISSGFQVADDQARRAEISEAAQAQVSRSKAMVAQNIGGFRAGLEKLETEFRANPRLQPFYPSLTSISDSITEAQQLASSNKFEEAGKALVSAAEKMADLLVIMK